jgi:putative component of membrane protein insertase Oxa1/YidC/SpoIIIJ protein YidD
MITLSCCHNHHVIMSLLSCYNDNVIMLSRFTTTLSCVLMLQWQWRFEKTGPDKIRLVLKHRYTQGISNLNPNFTVIPWRNYIKEVRLRVPRKYQLMFNPLVPSRHIPVCAAYIGKFLETSVLKIMQFCFLGVVCRCIDLNFSKLEVWKL